MAGDDYGPRSAFALRARQRRNLPTRMSAFVPCVDPLTKGHHVVKWLRGKVPHPISGGGQVLPGLAL